jgi:lipoyl(octanoyl) transferase
MTPAVLAFAHVLKRTAEALKAAADVEWRISDGPVSYLEAVDLMEGRADAIAKGEAQELIWFLEHAPLYTAGTSAKAADLLDPHRFPVYKTGRGGQYTYHGPGQLIAYAMLDLNRRGRDVRCYVHDLEQWLIEGLGACGVMGRRAAGHPGVWVERDQGKRLAKIAAVGVRVRRWITLHGVSINVCPDLSHFSGIVPCGITTKPVPSSPQCWAVRDASGEGLGQRGDEGEAPMLSGVTSLAELGRLPFETSDAKTARSPNLDEGQGAQWTS